jgi:hypothetical protein
LSRQSVKLFTNDGFPANLTRKAVLRLSINLPPVKRAIKRKLTDSHPQIITLEKVSGIVSEYFL